MSTITNRITVDEYEAMADRGEITPADRLVLIEGQLVKKMTKYPPHTIGLLLTYHTIHDMLPPGWHARKEDPVRIPSRDSEPEPDVAVVRGTIRTYIKRHPNETDIAMLVEVADSSVDDDRALAVTYGAAGIPVYWLVNVRDREVEVWSSPVNGAYLIHQVLHETESVDLVLGGQVVGQIPVTELLP